MLGGISMKKVLCAVLLIVVFAVSASAEVVGLLSRVNSSPEVFQKIVSAKRSEAVRTSILPAYGADVSCRFYDSMISMLMALNAGEIDSMSMPECVAEYIFRTNQQTEARGFMLGNGWMNLVMGLKEGNEALRDKISAAINEMIKDGSLTLLIRQYIQGPEAKNAKPAAFDVFEGAETITVAVTGDFPPIDYVDEGGLAAGYNSAMLAELGRRLHMNIKLIYTNAASRAAALMSGKADVVFWFELYSDKGEQFDIPEGIIYTVPYYGWNKNIYIGLEN